MLGEREAYAFGFFESVCAHAHVCDYQYVGTDAEAFQNQNQLTNHNYWESEKVFTVPMYGTCLERENNSYWNRIVTFLIISKPQTK